ncbi:hypothetical protein AVEN_31684-1 [Araneus ventricosus]|uniref:Uncharacterized protein n=1 Tax=Araneus ventricosus TaxID=182803 RepID=A0A4Y2RLK2_ARAVE|nr:hypothetical protein AVEN_31684-1 [Araneus ventricosus]
MAFLLARRKEDLMTIAADLDLTFEASFTKLKLKELIVKRPDYVEDDVKKMLDGIVEERTKGEDTKGRKRREDAKGRKRREDTKGRKRREDAKRRTRIRIGEITNTGPTDCQYSE